MAQMGRLLSSPEFAQSSRLQKFLKFIVEETLAGRADSLSEYAIALEVFERDESFDPQTSSVVRVEASRLRAKLEKYNAIDGRNEPIHIGLPTGRYIPTFQTAIQDVEPSEKYQSALPSGGTRRWGHWRVVALLVVLLSVVGATAFYQFGFRYLNSGMDRPLEPSKSGRISSVAVLPLRNLSGDAGEDYFSDGITEALITSLAKKALVPVISMTSVMGYKGVNRSVAEIARELNVSHVIEGSVLRVGKRVRITAQLIEANTDRHLWAESYERDVANVLAIQGEVVQRIVSSLSGKVASTKAISAKSLPAVNPAAYEAQLKGRFFRNKTTKEGFDKSIEYFKKAIELEPGYALAHSGLASCFCLLSGHGFEILSPKDAMPPAKTAAIRALELDGSLAEPHAFLGIIRLKYEWDFAGAGEAFKSAIQINPSYAQARLFYSFYLEAMGRQDEAIREAEQAKIIDPLSLAINVNLGWQYLQGGKNEQAKKVFESTAELSPNFWGFLWGMGHYYRQKGMFKEAIAAFQKAIEAKGGHTLPLSALGYTYAVMGKPTEARRALDRLKTLSREGYVSPFNMATIYAGLGEKDRAFAWLDKAYEERSRSLAWLNVAKEYDGLRSEPRFKTLIRRIGLPQ